MQKTAFRRPHDNSLKSLEKLERARRIERPTLTLARLCSTPELRPHSKFEGGGYRPSPSRFQANPGRAKPAHSFRHQAVENRPDRILARGKFPLQHAEIAGPTSPRQQPLQAR